jgi:hypothetical protein
MWPFLQLIIASLILVSCSSSREEAEEKMNSSFQNKYSQAVAAIQAQRQEPAEPQMVKIEAVKKSGDWRDGNFDPSYALRPNVAKGQMVKGQEVYMGEKLPEDMFEISYNLKNHPQYKKIGAEFDDIEIPDEDFYNVKTESADKSYLIVDGSVVRRNIAQTLNSRTSVDVANSAIIIAEYKEKTRAQKMSDMFDEVKIDDKKDIKNNSKDNKKKIDVKEKKPSKVNKSKPLKPKKKKKALPVNNSKPN